MGGFQVMNELMEMIDLPEWNRTWLTFAREYKEKARTITHNPFPVTRLTAYAAAKTGNRELAAEAWDELWHVWHTFHGASCGGARSSSTGGRESRGVHQRCGHMESGRHLHAGSHSRIAKNSLFCRIFAVWMR